jgi:AAHS family benzoate transporter-like MFS transporter
MDGIAEINNNPLNQIRGYGLRMALKKNALWAISISTSFCLFAGVPVILLTIPFLESLDYSKTTASTGMIAFTVSTVIGRLGSGYLADIYGNKTILIIGYLFVSIGTGLLFFADTLYLTMAFLLIIGPGFGATIPVRASLIAEYFGTTSFGTINGFCVFFSSFGAVLGPWITGKLVDITGSYSYGWLIVGLLSFLAIPILFFSKPPVHNNIEA